MAVGEQRGDEDGDGDLDRASWGDDDGVASEQPDGIIDDGRARAIERDDCERGIIRVAERDGGGIERGVIGLQQSGSGWRDVE